MENAIWYVSNKCKQDPSQIDFISKTGNDVGFNHCPALTAPVLLSTLQSGMIFESVTIQLLILSLLLLSTTKKQREKLILTTKLFLLDTCVFFKRKENVSSFLKRIL